MQLFLSMACKNAGYYYRKHLHQLYHLKTNLVNTSKIITAIAKHSSDSNGMNLRSRSCHRTMNVMDIDSKDIIAIDTRVIITNNIQHQGMQLTLLRIHLKVHR
jgi:hypothetical protein